LKSVAKLVGRFATTRGSFDPYPATLNLGTDLHTDDAKDLLPHLYLFDGEHREQGRALQADVAEFEAELKEAVEEIWARSLDEKETEDTWASRMAEIERSRQINPLDKVAKPDVMRLEKWKIGLYDL